MNTELVLYLFDYYSHFAPIKIVREIKYPYLNDYEMQIEKENIAQYLMEHHSSEIYINNCPKCQKLARTPRAKNPHVKNSDKLFYFGLLIIIVGTLIIGIQTI